MRIALYQPEIAGNLGTILRTCACFDVDVDVIEPCGFPLGDRQLKRSGMDYLQSVTLTRHVDWDAFLSACEARSSRLILFTSKSEAPFHQTIFKDDDVLLFGSEGAGVPDFVHEHVHIRTKIPMKSGMRSLNLAVSAGIALAEALRQTGKFPSL
jgi:tRNA (cytidine/uridine-2'-O-)-methyltransferase